MYIIYDLKENCFLLKYYCLYYAGESFFFWKTYKSRKYDVCIFF